MFSNLSTFIFQNKYPSSKNNEGVKFAQKYIYKIHHPILVGYNVFSIKAGLLACASYAFSSLPEIFSGAD